MLNGVKTVDVQDSKLAERALRAAMGARNDQVPQGPDPGDLRGGRHGEDSILSVDARTLAMPTLQPQAIDPATRQALEGVTTATLTTVLLKKGLRNVWIRGARPLAERLPARRVGRAFTLRFVPAREDLATPASWASPISTRAAIEAMPAGAIAVVDAMGTTDAGIFGDILCARMEKRGVAALVTDGVVRDLAGVLATGLPVWCQRHGGAGFGRTA